MAKTTLITGATAGIGAATARLLAKNGYDLIITGRRKGRLNNLKKDLEENTTAKVFTLNFDVRHRDEVEQALDALPDEWKDIDVLINNAGLAAGLGPLHEGDLDDWEQMIDTNVKGLLYVSRKILPGMVERRKGHVINISSTAGKEVYMNGNVYCATKFAVDALNKAMRLELVDHGVKVTSVNPGFTETEFSLVRFKGDEKKAKNVYQGIEPLHGEDIAEVILFILNRPDHVNINEIIVTPKAQANAYYMHREK
ncbi:MAG: SDR family NAD(P)-dependent oxidoreductase [Bacteroidales bacterium]|nr:SDR family NAD(P)-dependent oxidoreductase [Bacteroidales bacterium]